MPSHTYHFEVQMSCTGCSGAIERVLNKTTGIKSKDISLEKQTVDVITEDDSLTFDTVLDKIKKTNKTVVSASADGEAKSI